MVARSNYVYIYSFIKQDGKFHSSKDEHENIIHADHALLPPGWARNVAIAVDEGRVASVSTDQTAAIDGVERHAFVLPAMPNLHSHAFQRAMAGLTELRGSGSDSFWSWRTVMYRFALSMSPDQVEAVAAQLYMEMLEAGFGRVGEFHYLHHDRDGKEYSNIAEMAERICAAAEQTGVAMTLLPVFYAHPAWAGWRRPKGSAASSIRSAVSTGCRNVIVPPEGSTGQRLFDLALHGGNRALAGSSQISVGSPADLVSLATADHPWLDDRSVLDHMIFAGKPQPDCVWIGGKKLVEGGYHRSRDRIQARFKAVIQDLVSQL
ncbi:amidohydrolase family protein [Sinorhizobium meliloti]|nr:amidohydrolase family protein [Sinorhizobium meliloti]MDW9997578.1 amidohydrolase family protein [Sinorhizobium meliloti]